MTSCFMSIETSVISGALLYSKGISYLFPIGKRRVLFAKRSYIYIDTGSNPCTGNKKDGQPKLTVSTIFGWAVRGSACFAGGRCGAFAPCALRWQTLTRLLSSAPRRVRTRATATKKRPTGVDRFLFHGGPSGVRTLDLGIKSPLLCQLS